MAVAAARPARAKSTALHPAMPAVMASVSPAVKLVLAAPPAMSMSIMAPVSA
jgi:hypothetical protein